MTNEKRDTPVSVFELREVASGRIGYGDTKYHLHLLGLAADEIERLSNPVASPALLDALRPLFDSVPLTPVTLNGEQVLRIVAASGRSEDEPPAECRYPACLTEEPGCVIGCPKRSAQNRPAEPK